MTWQNFILGNYPCFWMIHVVMCCCGLKSPGRLINARVLRSLKLHSCSLSFSLYPLHTRSEWLESSRQECPYSLQTAILRAEVNVGQAQPQALTHTLINVWVIYVCIRPYAYVTDHTVSTAVLQTASDTQINMVLYHNRTKETWRGSRSVTGLCRFEWVICSVSILKPSLNINYTTYYCTRKMRFCCFSPFIFFKWGKMLL